MHVPEVGPPRLHVLDVLEQVDAPLLRLFRQACRSRARGRPEGCASRVRRTRRGPRPLPAISSSVISPATCRGVGNAPPTKPKRSPSISTTSPSASRCTPGCSDEASARRRGCRRCRGSGRSGREGWRRPLVLLHDHAGRSRHGSRLRAPRNARCITRRASSTRPAVRRSTTSATAFDGEDLGQDPGHRGVVDEVDQVAQQQQRRPFGHGLREVVGGPVEVGDDVDRHPDIVRCAGEPERSPFAGLRARRSLGSRERKPRRSRLRGSGGQRRINRARRRRARRDGDGGRSAFNAGYGSVLNKDGGLEMDAGIVDGRTGRSGGSRTSTSSIPSRLLAASSRRPHTC